MLDLDTVRRRLGLLTLTALLMAPGLGAQGRYRRQVRPGTCARRPAPEAVRSSQIATARFTELLAHQRRVIAFLLRRQEYLERRMARVLAAQAARNASPTATSAPVSPTTSASIPAAPTPAHLQAPGTSTLRAVAPSASLFGLPGGADTPAPDAPSPAPAITPSATPVAPVPLGYQTTALAPGQPGFLAELAARLQSDYLAADAEGGKPDSATGEFRRRLHWMVERGARAEGQMMKKASALGYGASSSDQGEVIAELREDVQRLHQLRHRLKADLATATPEIRDQIQERLPVLEHELTQRQGELAEYTQGSRPEADLLLPAALASHHVLVLRFPLRELRRVDGGGEAIHPSLHAAWKLLMPHHNIARGICLPLRKEARRRGVLSEVDALIGYDPS